MAFLDKLNDLANAASGVASSAAEKAGDAIELGKLNMKVVAEEKKIADATMKIGELMVESLDAGQDYGPTFAELHQTILEAREAIASHQENKARVNRQIICPVCGAKNPMGSKFCGECGAKQEEPEVVAEVVELEQRCPNCGAQMPKDEKFCTQCGTKLTPDANSEETP